MDIEVYLHARRPEIIQPRLSRIITRTDTSDLEAYMKDHDFHEIRNFVQYLVVYSEVKLLRKLIQLGLDVNKGIGMGALAMMCFSGGQAHLESLLFLLRHKLELNFKINYRGVVANFLDLIVHISCSDPIINLLITNGAYVFNPMEIPFSLGILNVEYNTFLLNSVYNKKAHINGQLAIDYLIHEDYQRYSPHMAALKVNPDELKMATRLLMLTVLPLNYDTTRSILISVAGKVILGDGTLPLVNCKVAFEDLIHLAHALRMSVLSDLTWDVDGIAFWLFSLPCDTEKLIILREEGVDFNLISSHLKIREDWQLALMQTGIAGQKPKVRFANSILLNLKGTGDSVSSQKSINHHLLNPDLLKQYQEYCRRRSRNKASPTTSGHRGSKTQSLSLTHQSTVRNLRQISTRSEEPNFEDVHLSFGTPR